MAYVLCFFLYALPVLECLVVTCRDELLRSAAIAVPSMSRLLAVPTALHKCEKAHVSRLLGLLLSVRT